MLRSAPTVVAQGSLSSSSPCLPNTFVFVPLPAPPVGVVPGWRQLPPTPVFPAWGPRPPPATAPSSARDALRAAILISTPAPLRPALPPALVRQAVFPTASGLTPAAAAPRGAWGPVSKRARRGPAPRTARPLSLAELDAFGSGVDALAFAPATVRGRTTAESRFTDFLALYAIHIGPQGISDADLSRYIHFLASEPSINSFDTIPTYLSNGPAQWHKNRGLPYSSQYAARPAVHMALRGAKKILKDSTGTRRRLALTTQILLELHPHLSFEDPADVCFWAAALTAFYCLLRKSNVCVPSARPLSAAMRSKASPALQLGSLVSTRQGQDWWLILTETKTIQNCERVLRLPLPLIPGSPLCPRAALQRFFANTRTRPTHPLSHYLFGWRGAAPGSWVPLTHASFVGRLKSLLVAAGYDPSRFAGHSFRRGGATFAFAEAGLSSLHIKALGDWVSDVFMQYCEVQESLRLAGARAMAAATQRTAAPASH